MSVTHRTGAELRGNVRFLVALTRSDRCCLLIWLRWILLPMVGDELGLSIGEAMPCGTPIFTVDATCLDALRRDSGFYDRKVSEDVEGWAQDDSRVIGSISKMESAEGSMCIKRSIVRSENFTAVKALDQSNSIYWSVSYSYGITVRSSR